MRTPIYALLGITGAIFLGGCASVTHAPPVPEAEVMKAEIPGFAGVRHIHGFNEVEFITDYQSAMAAAKPDATGVSLLALSGGGANGAFGAGALVGWSELGTRPEFQIVTGVSTGALAAPFAFLGSAYDGKLKHAYTSVHDHEIFSPQVVRSFLRFLHVDALANTDSFHRLLDELIDEVMLDAIAAEYRKGRRLYVCTHDMASGHAVYWNMTAIAASERKDALALFHRVLIASSSLPIIFPPQYFEVEVNGKRYTEMHMDGGLSRQAFFHLNGARAGLKPRADGTIVPMTAYIIRNGRVRQEYEEIPSMILPIAMRTVGALVASQGVGDMYRIYSQTIEEQAQFRLMMIPESFALKHRGIFEPEFMARLFELGRESVKSTQPWQNRPPFLSSSDGS